MFHLEVHGTDVLRAAIVERDGDRFASEPRAPVRLVDVELVNERVTAGQSAGSAIR